MAFGYNVVGWEDTDGNRHDGMPSSPAGVYGQLIHAYDPATGQDEFFWAFVPEDFEDWDTWWIYIEGLMDMYGLSVA